MADSGTPNLLVEVGPSGVATLTLNRPEVHNAFDADLIAAIARELERLEGNATLRAVVLAANGKSFSAGADLNWMRRTAEASIEENRAEARAMAEMLQRLDRLEKPTLAVVQGAALGGGVGLVAACDVAIAAESAVFGLTEARLGLAPAVVAPYVIRAIGARAARRYFLTAERFAAMEAKAIGLVHEVAPVEALGALRDRVLAALAEGGAQAQAGAKRAIERYRGRAIDEELIEDAVNLIAGLRASPEGREGIAAFLEKRPPAWRR